MYAYINEDDKNKKLLYVYTTLIFFMLIANGIGNIYISVKSEKEEKIILKSLEEYEDMSPDEADEVVQSEITAIANNAKILLHNAVIEGIVAMITATVVCFLGLLCKGIVKIAETDNIYSNYSCMIVKISGAMAVLEVIGSVKGIFDNIAMYRHVMGYYYDIYWSLFGFLSNIENQIIK